MNVYIKKNHEKTGLARFCESFSIVDASIEYIENLDNVECDIGIFGGFLPDDIEKAKARKKYYVFCSPFGQAELSSHDFYSSEITLLYYILTMRGQGAITDFLTPSISLASRFNGIYIPPVKILDPSDIYYDNERAGYGFLGNNFRKHRNVVNQLAAISLLPKQNIVVRQPEVYKNYEMLFNCKFVDKIHVENIKEDPGYYKEISKHILGFQCSWSEAFNYIALEYAYQGVPCIVSSCINWYPVPDCVVDNVDHWRNIYNAASRVLNNKNRYAEICADLKEWTNEHKENSEIRFKEIAHTIVNA